MDDSELVSALGRFGLHEREARLYLTLLKLGGATARDLTHDSQVDRVLTYRALELLRARGVVQTTAERPRRFLPVAPAAVLDRHLQERKSQIDSDHHLARTLVEALPSAGTSLASGTPRFQMVNGPSAAYRQLREMVQRTRVSLWTMITPKALRGSWNAGLADDVSRSIRAGHEFRMIIEPDPTVGSFLRRLLADPKRYRTAEVRGINPQRSRLAISDAREVMMFLVPEARAPGIEEVAVWTDSPEFVAAQSGYFESIWHHALPLRIPSVADRTSKTRPDRGRRKRLA